MVQVMAYRQFWVCQAITRINADLLSIGRFETKLNEIRSEIQNSSSKKMHSKMSSGKWWPFCSGGDELIYHCTICYKRNPIGIVWIVLSGERDSLEENIDNFCL